MNETEKQPLQHGAWGLEKQRTKQGVKVKYRAPRVQRESGLKEKEQLCGQRRVHTQRWEEHERAGPLGD